MCFANLTQHCGKLDLPHTRQISAAKLPSRPPACDNPVQLCFDSDAALVALLSCFCAALVVIVRRRVQLMPSASGNPTSVSPVSLLPLCNPFSGLLVYCLRCSRQRRWQQRCDCCRLQQRLRWHCVASGKWRVAFSPDSGC